MCCKPFVYCHCRPLHEAGAVHMQSTLDVDAYAHCVGWLWLRCHLMPYVLVAQQGWYLHHKVVRVAHTPAVRHHLVCNTPESA